MSEAKDQDSEGLDSSRCSVAIYLVGCWVDTGPRANDCYFEVGYVTTDLTLANEMARKFTDAVIMTAKDGSSFIDWESL
jgi:hypothetical protein